MNEVSLSNSVVTITGGTGSFGTQVAKHLLNRNVSELRIFSRDELKQDLLRSQLRDGRVRFMLGDTRDFDSLAQAIAGADFVFHAAALKQVPSAEFFPIEASKTNIFGSDNVLRQSVRNGVKAVVCLSTDKAVYPINAMGISKAMMEKVAIAAARENSGSTTRIVVTRYGNVVASRGSVIPRFVQQIESNQPLTVTSGTMTRFLMSLSESVELVEFAMRKGVTGDILVKKSPAATVSTIASAVAELKGHKDHPILQIGFRHGEKLFESLLSAEERAKAQDLGEYFRVPMDERDLNYASFFETGELERIPLEAYTSENTERLDLEALVQKLEGIDEVRRLIHG